MVAPARNAPKIASSPNAVATAAYTINSAIAAYYYLRIVVVMYMRESRKQIAVTPVPAGLGLALAISVAATLYLGILPSRVLQYTEQSAQELLPPSPASIVSNTLQKQPPAGIPGR